MVVGYWLLVVGYWLLVIGCWLLVVGYWLLVVGYWKNYVNKTGVVKSSYLGLNIYIINRGVALWAAYQSRVGVFISNTKIVAIPLNPPYQRGIFNI